MVELQKMARQQKLIKEIPNLWRPEFIPFYPAEKEKYRLNDMETLIYGFVRFFLKNCSGRFYFTNEQLRYVLVGVKRDGTISDIVSGLAKKCDEIKVSYVVKKTGGKIRMMEYSGSRLTENRNSDLRKTVNNREYVNKNTPTLRKKKNVHDERPRGGGLQSFGETVGKVMSDDEVRKACQ